MPPDGRGGGGGTSPRRPGPGRATPERRAASQAPTPALPGRVGRAGAALRRLESAGSQQECERGLDAPPRTRAESLLASDRVTGSQTTTRHNADVVAARGACA